MACYHNEPISFDLFGDDNLEAQWQDYADELMQELRRKAERTIKVFEDDPELLQWSLAGNAQICPGCCLLVSKSRGCNHMKCFACHTEFCYNCGCEWPHSKHGQSSSCKLKAPRLNFDDQLLVERKRQRMYAFLGGTHPRLGADSFVYKLPPDAVQLIASHVLDMPRRPTEQELIEKMGALYDGGGRQVEEEEEEEEEEEDEDEDEDEDDGR